MRGEHLDPDVRALVDPGSSPRARGARIGLFRRSPIGRIIPACAGSTACSDSTRTRSRDHPRVRGEHRCPFLFVVISRGSSPRARGALWRPAFPAADLGIIPACAGSTRTRTWPVVPSGDHPRVRGEHSGSSRTGYRARGSSPRARGALPRPYEPVQKIWIIPACAGSTCKRAATAS